MGLLDLETIDLRDGDAVVACRIIKSGSEVYANTYKRQHCYDILATRPLYLVRSSHTLDPAHMQKNA